MFKAPRIVATETLIFIISCNPYTATVQGGHCYLPGKYEETRFQRGRQWLHCSPGLSLAKLKFLLWHLWCALSKILHLFEPQLPCKEDKHRSLPPRVVWRIESDNAWKTLVSVPGNIVKHPVSVKYFVIIVQVTAAGTWPSQDLNPGPSLENEEESALWEASDLGTTGFCAAGKLPTKKALLTSLFLAFWLGSQKHPVFFRDRHVITDL